MLTVSKIKTIFLADLNSGYTLKDYCEFWNLNYLSITDYYYYGRVNKDYKHLFFKQGDTIILLTNLIHLYPPSILFPHPNFKANHLNYTVAPTPHMTCTFAHYCEKWNLNPVRFENYIANLSFGQYLKQGDSLLFPVETSPVLACLVSQNRLFGENKDIKEFIKCFNNTKFDQSERSCVHLRSEFTGRYIKVSDLLPVFKEILEKKYGKNKVYELEFTYMKDTYLKPFRAFFLIDDIEPIGNPSYEIQQCFNWDIVNMCMHISDPKSKPLTKWDYEKWQTDPESYEDTGYGTKTIPSFDEDTILGE